RAALELHHAPARRPSESGSRDLAVDEYDHVAVARRQPGSTLKPFVYAAALQRGFSPMDRLTDEAVDVDHGHSRVWRPTNSGSVSDRKSTRLNFSHVKSSY